MVSIYISLRKKQKTKPKQYLCRGKENAFLSPQFLAGLKEHRGQQSQGEQSGCHK